MTDSGIRAVYLQERAKLQRMLVARLGNQDEAEDVLQELWIKLQHGTFGPISSPLAYLFKTANNLAIDRRRSDLWRNVRETSWVEVQPGADELPSTTDAMIARERLAHVEAAIATLPERTARAFRLYRLDGMPQKEIARELGVSLSLVEKLLQQAYRCIHDAGRENIAGSQTQQRLSSKEDRT
ncbi:RNA polymerase sigma factor [Sphingomonas sp.]|uniref:RNA polymerase sigma factor n=1 Tax=Sphingomonas sp. TaxID=28214 RepID=UPI000DB3DDA3|nr:RNA polymerase sigma factor [Sphingomonas sp.]PZU06889.1 MAG: RNA polymerase subunit sigma-70 [Sphingomonas sp.]